MCFSLSLIQIDMATMYEYQDGRTCPAHGFVAWQHLANRSTRAKVSVFIQFVKLIHPSYSVMPLIQLPTDPAPFPDGKQAAVPSRCSHEHQLPPLPKKAFILHTPSPSPPLVIQLIQFSQRSSAHPEIVLANTQTKPAPIELVLHTVVH